MWGKKREYVHRLFCTWLCGLLPVCEWKLKTIQSHQELGMSSAFVTQYRQYQGAYRWSCDLRIIKRDTCPWGSYIYCSDCYLFQKWILKIDSFCSHRVNEKPISATGFTSICLIFCLKRSSYRLIMSFYWAFLCE